MSEALYSLFGQLGGFLALTWWLWAFFLLAPLSSSIWRFWRNEHYLRSTNMVLLELLLPRETLKSPRAMEQVLTAIHALRNSPGDIVEQWWDGESPRTFSFEIVSFGGEVHFYVRTFIKTKMLVEAAFYANYPDIEIIEADDYVTRFPGTLKEMNAQNYTMWGSEITLAKESPYPIKTFEDFESPDEEKEYDPISALIEVFAKAKKEEIVAIQFLATPVAIGWQKKWQPLVRTLKESKGAAAAVAKKRASRSWDFSTGILPITEVVVGDSKEDNAIFKSFMRTPGETDTLKAVEENLDRPAFEMIIRVNYFSPRESFYESYAKRGVMGSLNQYAHQSMNSFRAVTKTLVYPAGKPYVKPFIFANTRNNYKKQRLIYDYRHRNIQPENFIGKVITSSIFDWNFKKQPFEITTKCFATIFHPPTRYVTTTPHIRQVASKKAGPPAGLAIFGDEKEIESYQ